MYTYSSYLCSLFLYMVRLGKLNENVPIYTCTCKSMIGSEIASCYFTVLTTVCMSIMLLER